MTVLSRILYRLYEARLRRDLRGKKRPRHIAVMADGSEVRTVEGLAGLRTAPGVPHPLQDAFGDERARDAVVNVVLHLLLGVGAAWLGWAVAT